MTAPRLLLALGGGVLVALTVPPFGWWILGPVGLAVLCHLLDGRPVGARVATGAAFSLGLYTVSLAWVREFTAPGMVVWILFTAAYTAIPLALVPPHRGRLLAFAPTIVVVELLRGVWPFEGLPLSGIDLGQSGGPLAPAAGLGGRLLLVGLVALAGAGLAALAERPRRTVPGLVALALVAVTTAAAWVAPRGEATGTLRVAVVQGGGPRGIPARDADSAAVFAAHVAASRRVRPPVDVVLWPEDVVDVHRLDGSAEDEALSRLARALGATLVAGIVEDAGPGRFRNAAVAYGPDGRLVDRYEKVRRVPFGEYFPFRSFLERFATLPADDAIPGPHRPGLLRTPAGPMGVVISYEVFFQGRARSAIGAGGDVLLVPTNASSFTNTQMPAQELAAARLRAWQTGRDVLQAAPTGFSALIDHRGRVRAHSDLGARAVLQGTVARRTGRTPYGRTGDWPAVTATVASLAAAWVLDRRRRRSPRVE